jgi:hypothetical protein
MKIRNMRSPKVQAISAALCAFTLLVACDSNQEQDRYQIVTQGAVIMKIDKKTGQAWQWKPRISDGGEWAPVQNPN